MNKPDVVPCRLPSRLRWRGGRDGAYSSAIFRITVGIVTGTSVDRAGRAVVSETMRAEVAKLTVSEGGRHFWGIRHSNWRSVGDVEPLVPLPACETRLSRRFGGRTWPRPYRQ